MLILFLSFPLAYCQDNFFVGDFTPQFPLYNGRFFSREPRGSWEEGSSSGIHDLREITTQPPAIISSPTCSYDPEKWSFHEETSLMRAIMFQRTTGGSCVECLANCTVQQKPPWVCRSVVYDLRWSICDLFAITSSHPPFDMVAFDGRQYFEYLPALPPSDNELVELVKISDRDFSHKVACSEIKSKKHSGEIIKKEVLAKKKHKKKNKKSKKSKEILFESTTTEPSTTEISTTTTSEETSTIPVRTEVSSTDGQTSGVFLITSTTEEIEDLWDMEDISDPPTTTMISTVEGIIEESSTVGGTTQERTTIPTSDAVSSTTTQDSLIPISTDGSTLKPKRIAFKGPRVQKIHGARTSSTDDLAGFIDISEARTQDPVASICSEDDIMAMVEFISTKRRRPFNSDLKTSRTLAAEECSEACERDDECSSAISSPTGCQLASTKGRRSRLDLITAPGYTYIEKICLRRNVARDRGTLFSAVRNFIVAGFVEEVEDARSMEDCIGLCLKARKKHGFHCLSVMWYPTDKEQNCVLNREAGSRKPEHFMRADQSVQMVYVEIPDAVDVKELVNEDFRRDDPLPSPKWTIWSSCEGRSKDDMRYRYKKCSDKPDIRKCPKQTAFCGPNPRRGPKIQQLDNATNI